MLSIAPFLAIGLACAALAAIVWNLRSLRGTTLLSAGAWATLAATLFLSTAGFHGFTFLSPGGIDMAWYAVAVAGLCPFVSVLGARRPGAGVWNWFVVLPLIAVLLWPALVAASHSSGNGLQMDTPPLVGFAAVLLMACGNYFGTRFRIAALLYAAAEFLLAAPATAWGESGFFNSRLRAIGMICWPIAILLAWWFSRRPAPEQAGFDRTWLDFRDAYGLVWARRVQDRINERAAGEQWCARLEAHGFHWEPDASQSQRQVTAERIDHTVRWILRRFVDDRWLDARLGTHSSDSDD